MYVIYFIGLFEEGYVRHSLFGYPRSKFIPFPTEADVLAQATKHKYECYANFWCKIYNKLSLRRTELRAYSVKKVN